MTLHHHCEGCSRPIEGRYFIELGIRVLLTAEGSTQDSKEEWWGDYCPTCLGNGQALRDLRKALTGAHKELIEVVK